MALRPRLIRAALRFPIMSLTAAFVITVLPAPFPSAAGSFACAGTTRASGPEDAAEARQREEHIRHLRSELRRVGREGTPEALNRILEQLQHAGGLHPADAMTAAGALAQLDHPEEASRIIEHAIDQGHVDPARIRLDPALASLRARGLDHALLARARARLSADAVEHTRALREELADPDGTRYRFAYDEVRHILYAAALDDRAFDELRVTTERLHDYLIEHLFGAPPPYVFRVVIPDPSDAPRMLGEGDPVPTGRYDHRTRTVLARHTGSPLQHEFVHALHFGHMERLGLRTPHPLWIQEGLATLFEHVEWPDERTPVFLPNARSRITNNLARRSRLMHWSDLMQMESERFMSTPTRTYPEVRSIFEFLAAHDLLGTWYAALADTFDDDSSGLRAFERAFDRPADEVEQQYRLWARERAGRPGDDAPPRLWLGIEWDEAGANDGARIARTLPAGPAARARLRPGDVIVFVHSRRIHEPEDIERAVAGRRAGDDVDVEIRRGDRYETVSVRLAAPPRGLRSF